MIALTLDRTVGKFFLPVRHVDYGGDASKSYSAVGPAEQTSTKTKSNGITDAPIIVSFSYATIFQEKRVPLDREILSFRKQGFTESE